MTGLKIGIPMSEASEATLRNQKSVLETLRITRAAIMDEIDSVNKEIVKLQYESAKAKVILAPLLVDHKSKLVEDVYTISSMITKTELGIQIRELDI